MNQTLFWLLVGHALADYPLQGDFLAKAKNHLSPIPGVPWIQGLIWHSMIHAGAVALATGSVALGCAECYAHCVIDYGKSAGWFGTGERAFTVYQTLHVLCKMLWVAILFAGR